MSTESKTFLASQENLLVILEWTRAHIQRSALASTEKQRVELALEEAVVNVVNHAKSEEALQLTVLARLVGDDQLEFELIDNGAPFNPLSHTRHKADIPLDEREPGGLGLMLIKKCMDSVTYRHEGSCNILTLTKNLR